jgi:hypothetical protein
LQGAVPSLGCGTWLRSDCCRTSLGRREQRISIDGLGQRKLGCYEEEGKGSLKEFQFSEIVRKKFERKEQRKGREVSQNNFQKIYLFMFKTILKFVNNKVLISLNRKRGFI